MNDQPLVSVVIATYNMGQYLPEAIDSVLAQRWENLEVIVVDDGSTDDTPEQMKRFEGNGRVRYLPTENRGQPKAKNRGLSPERYAPSVRRQGAVTKLPKDASETSQRSRPSKARPDARGKKSVPVRRSTSPTVDMWARR